jgi:hypothetical protein
MPDPHALPAAIVLALAVMMYALAVARVSRLITTDTITARPREWITERADARRATRPLAALLDCDWCVTVWVSGALTALDALAHGPMAALVGALAPAGGASAALAWAVIVAALAQLAGMLATRT